MGFLDDLSDGFKTVAHTVEGGVKDVTGVVGDVAGAGKGLLGGLFGGGSGSNPLSGLTSMFSGLTMSAILKSSGYIQMTLLR